jgi:hypothetical protein
MSKERTWTDFWKDINDVMVPDQRNDLEIEQLEEADLIRKYNSSREHPISEESIEAMKKNGIYNNWIERIRNPEPVKLADTIVPTAPPHASMVVSSSEKELLQEGANMTVTALNNDAIPSHLVEASTESPIIAVPLGDPVEKISLSGRALFNDLLEDIREHDYETLSDRFKETIKGAITGYGNKDVIEEVSLTREEEEYLNNLVATATRKLRDELDKENKSSSYWKYTNSVEKAAQKRWAINFVGHAYDAVGSMCHGMGKMIGLSKPTAAELFNKAAQYAETLQDKLVEKQTNRDDLNREEGEKANTQYYDLKRRGQDRNVEDKVQDHSEKVAKHSFSKLVEQVGHKGAEDVMKHGLKYKEKPVYPSFDALDNVLKASAKANPSHKKELQSSDVHLAMAEVQAVLFPADLVTTNITVTDNNLIDKKTIHETKVNLKEVRDAVRKLESAINKKGNEHDKAALNAFKEDVHKNMPKRSWAQTIRENVGFSGKGR